MEFVQTVKHKNKGSKKGLSLIFKQGTKQDYMNKKQEHKMCKKNVETIFFMLTYVNMNMKKNDKAIMQDRA
jgi:hypothetical protein